ncbi:MAG: site-2 protease family protein [Chlamydiae bacterium]|nr:site-2 protease family protein [Chlamydiota bacterium]
MDIPVRILPTFWLFLVVFSGMYRGLSWYSLILGVVLMLSLLTHEYGHALTARYFGARPEITLEGFGGYAQYDQYLITPKQRFLIILNGPLFEGILILIPYLLLKWHLFQNHYVLFFLSATMQINILWCLLNLIPVMPLDGGHLVRYLLESKFGAKGQKATLVIGLISSLVAVPYLFYMGFFFFGTLLGIFGYQNLKLLWGVVFFSHKVYPFDHYVRGIEAMKGGDLAGAKAILKKLLKCKDKQMKNSAIVALSNIHLQENEGQKSYELLLSADHELLKEGKHLLCKLAFERKNYPLVCKYAREIYEIEPSFEVAVLNSKAFACVNEAVYAGGWLETASLFGNDYREDVKGLIVDPIYDGVREHEGFKHYAEKIIAPLVRHEKNP